MSVKETYYKPGIKDGAIVEGAKYVTSDNRESLVRFDDAGMKTEEISYFPGGDTVSRTTWFYDGSLNLVAMEIYRPGLSVDRVHNSMSYDGNKVSEITWLNPPGTFRGKETFAYNKTGNLVERCSYDSDTVLSKKKTWAYDSLGRVTQMCFYVSKEKLRMRVEYAYDEFGRLSLEKATNGKGKFMHAFSTEYNPQGFPSVVRRLNKKLIPTSETSFEYEFDSSGNWTKRISRKGTKPWMIATREITYRN